MRSFPCINACHSRQLGSTLQACTTFFWLGFGALTVAQMSACMLSQSADHLYSPYMHETLLRCLLHGHSKSIMSCTQVPSADMLQVPGGHVQLWQCTAETSQARAAMLGVRGTATGVPGCAQSCSQQCGVAARAALWQLH